MLRPVGFEVSAQTVDINCQPSGAVQLKAQKEKELAGLQDSLHSGGRHLSDLTSQLAVQRLELAQADRDREA